MAPLVAGITAIVLGVVALFWPGVTVRAITVVVGFFLAIEAVVSLLSMHRTPFLTYSAVAQGVVGLILALVLLLAPGTALRTVITLVAIVFVVRAVGQFWGAYNYRRMTGAPLFVGSFGGLSLVVGLLLFVRPEAALVAFAWLIGFYAIVSGIFLISWSRRVEMYRDGERVVGPDLGAEDE